jgi:hypothetical protein
MYLDGVVGIVRRVFSIRSDPELGCLIPAFRNQQYFLYYVQVPFGDDVRKFTLESFNTIKKFKPTDQQLKLVDDLIDSMDLTKGTTQKNVNEDEQDEEEEPYDPHSTFNPYIQRMFQSIASKASNPDDDLPDFDNHITASHLQKIGERFRNNKQTVSLLKRCEEAFPVKVDPKKIRKNEENIFHTKDASDKVVEEGPTVSTKEDEPNGAENENGGEQAASSSHQELDDEMDDLVNQM